MYRKGEGSAREKLAGGGWWEKKGEVLKFTDIGPSGRKKNAAQKKKNQKRNSSGEFLGTFTL